MKTLTYALQGFVTDFAAVSLAEVGPRDRGAPEMDRPDRCQ